MCIHNAPDENIIQELKLKKQNPVFIFRKELLVNSFLASKMFIYK